MKGITRDCLMEFVDRKIVWAFVAVLIFAVLVVFISSNIEASFHMESTGDMEMGDLNDALGNPILKGFSILISVMIFLSVMASAGHIPKMLERGRAEFYLSKPLSRSSLLISKLVSIWAVYGGTILIGGLLVHVVLWLVHGVFDSSIISLQLLSLVTLFIWLTITCFFGLLSGSAGIAIATAFLLWVAEEILSYREMFKELLQSRIADILIDSFYYVLPKTSAASDVFVALASNKIVRDWTPVWTTLLFALVMLLGSVWLVKRRDF